MRSLGIGHDFLSRYLFFGLGLSFLLWLFNYQIKGGDLSSLFFSSLNLLFHYQLFILDPNLNRPFGQSKFYFYELILGQFLFSCLVVFESGTPVIGFVVLYPVMGSLIVSESFDYFPTLLDKELEDETQGDERSKLFFHDVINKTHGMKLYLRNQKDQKKEIGLKGIEDLLNEVESLQLLLKDYFREGHKDLQFLDDYVEVEKAIKGAKRLLAYFIPDCQDEDFLESVVSLGYHVLNNQKEKSLIHYASFYRIFGNLMKNISDHGGQDMSVNFDIKEGQFHIVVRNNFEKKQNDSQGPSIEKSFGLRSIEKNCLEQNGNFRFSRKDKEWKSEICLPLKVIESEVYGGEKKERA
ncbi:MAG: hypothetical protein CME68_12160 [Halobacteriovoraceae bacterium]|nr:hypothetical protein [Halobacteriovoraceae bacterium]